MAKDNSKEKVNALFIQRLLAYIIDIVIISFAASLISYPFYDTEGVQKLSKSSGQIVEKHINQEVDIKTYITESIDISYELAKKNGIISLVTVFLGIIYFVVFQFYNNGQTLGKKVLHIKIEKDDDSELTINDLIFRSLVVNSILSDIIVICFVIFASKNVYFYGVGLVQGIQYTVLLISALMVMFKKNSRGLHDMIANTKVVRDNSVKELEICES